MRIFPERPVLRLFVINGVMGAVIGMVLASIFIFGDFFGLYQTMQRSIGVIAGWAMLSYVFACTFAGLAMATAVMLHWDRGDDDDDKGGGLGSRADDAPGFQAVPVRVRSGH
ncbi:hypothetical protein WJT86_02145 [Microvirga sp. W0021]|uniref:Uncharacterized protein n=1 Tax=Hohaiivirga grylli TaxID=3133970 RepID=A0ABV0BHU8_9HYPH